MDIEYDHEHAHVPQFALPDLTLRSTLFVIGCDNILTLQQDLYVTPHA